MYVIAFAMCLSLSGTPIINMEVSVMVKLKYIIDLTSNIGETGSLVGGESKDINTTYCYRI